MDSGYGKGRYFPRLGSVRSLTGAQFSADNCTFQMHSSPPKFDGGDGNKLARVACPSERGMVDSGMIVPIFPVKFQRLERATAYACYDIGTTSEEITSINGAYVPTHGHNKS